jgi:uncharacterized DUF497 family protein
MADLFFMCRFLHVPVRRNDESRFASTALKEGKFLTVIWTWRGSDQRIISYRRAWDAEERAYRQVYG